MRSERTGKIIACRDGQCSFLNKDDVENPRAGKHIELFHQLKQKSKKRTPLYFFFHLIPLRKRIGIFYSFLL